ncbi:MAG: CehA/McbA family metallohydrolase [Anaerolineaceae bacterium]|nr:CehA/McbA family metallohydrolase [Anaerolineaceae bacterium]MBN2678308.1 CehA/McbA family metallohydrolase [Anaerolineaceae bacterium]
MSEIITNLHIHSTYSDGYFNHAGLARAAMRAGLDAILVTDHNVYVDGIDAYHHDGRQRVLLLACEEIHNQARIPQKSHLLVLGARRELAQYASDTQELINQARHASAATFLAHPHEEALPAFGEGDLGWDDWDVTGYTGIELWNAMSEFKTRATSTWKAIYYAYHFEKLAAGPHPLTLKKWDELLSSGQKVVAVGGSDAHQLDIRKGPLHVKLYPYEKHFRAVNTHLILSAPLTGEVENDREMIYAALRSGHAFVGYDLPAPTRGFAFTAQGKQERAIQGDVIRAKGGVTLQARLPLPAEARLIHNGKIIKEYARTEAVAHSTSQPGAYRIEAYRFFKGERRGWIFSNPIYLK